MLYAGEEDEDGNVKYTPEEAARAAESANGRVRSDESTLADTAETAVSGEDTSEGDEEQTAAAPMNMNSIYLVVGVVALIGVGAAGFFLMKKKNGGSASKQEVSDYELEDDDFEFSDEDQDE